MQKDKNRKESKWLTEEEAAEYLRLTKRTLINWRNNGMVQADGEIKAGPPYYKPAGRYYYDQYEIDEWIREGRGA